MAFFCRYIPILVCAALFLGVSEAQSVGTITGTVTDAESGEKLEAVQIYIPVLKKIKLVSFFSQSRETAGAFYTLAIFVEQESSTEEDVFLPWSSTIRCDSSRYRTSDMN